MANHEQGAFDIMLDSKRTRRALDILQGLTRDQPLAALYGYRVERGLRDALLGKFIWPLRLALSRGACRRGAGRRAERSGRRARRRRRRGAAGRRGRPMPNAVSHASRAVHRRLDPPTPAPANPSSRRSRDRGRRCARSRRQRQRPADGRGHASDRAGQFGARRGAMAVADKQALPIETQVGHTPRGGASYTQRIALLCPGPVDGWPEDRRSRAEPAVNAWIASMLGDPTRYRFVARVMRTAATAVT